jgi:hypothetical protein
MKKVLPVIVIVIILAAVMYLQTSGGSSSGDGTTTASSDMNKQGNSDEEQSWGDGSAGSSERQNVPQEILDDPDADDGFGEDIKPATELYTSAEQALEAVKSGSVDYDDLVLEQFAELGEECTWCDEFYGSVGELMLAPESNDDERSYYAEVLAISGRVDNVAALVNATKNADDENAADIYAEALEVTIGDDKVVRYLGEQLTTENELLKESVVAAITNHGSRNAIDLLYRETVKEGDPDGFYSLGIGLGEVIPEEDSLPYLTELTTNRDAYSHLSLKALLNYGDDGLKTVMNLLESSNNPEFDKQMLQDAVDHVAYEENTEEYLRDIIQNSESDNAKEFANEILEDFDLEEEEEFDEEELDEDTPE